MGSQGFEVVRGQARHPGKVCGVRGIGGRAILLGLALLAGCSNGDGLLTSGLLLNGGIDDLTPPSVEYAPGEVVARLQLDAPETEHFVLRGTVPLTAGVYPRADGATPFRVRNADGLVSPAQLEIVSRFANPEHGADVVEVLARVERPVGATSGQRLVYDVLFDPGTPSAFAPTQAFADLLAHGVRLETRDVFGHRYRADLLRDLRDDTSDLRRLREGHAARQVRTHEILVAENPVAGPTGTLPHHVGVHAYVTSWSEGDVVSLDLRIYNGGSGRNLADPLDDPNAKLYFDGFFLRIPAGWHALSAFQDPFRGLDVVSGNERIVSLVEPLDGDKLHMMPPQANLSRRLVLYRDGQLPAARTVVEEQSLAFCMDGTSPTGKRLASWWNPATARYLAPRQPMPSLAGLNLAELGTRLEDTFEYLRDTLAQGIANPWPLPILHGVMGWAHPYGHGIGYAHGGDEIEFFPGVDVAYMASQAGYRTFQMAHRMYNARHATTLYDADGEPTRLESWLRPGGPTGQWNPTWVWIKPVLWLGDPFGFNAAPSFQVDAVVFQQRQPDYENALLAFQHIDDQHLVRYTRPPKVLAWLGNDALAKDDLLMQAELVRLTYSNYPNDTQGAGIAIGMYTVAQFVDLYPRRGARVHRGTGWEVDAVATAYALALPSWRAPLAAWCDGIVDLLERAQDACTGVLGSNPNGDQFGGQYRARQSISESILENGLWGMRLSVYADERPEMSARLGNILIRSSYAMVSSMFWNAQHGQPHFYTALGPHDATQPPFCNYVPPDGQLSYENYQGWPTLAYGYRLTGNALFLNKALEMAGGNIGNVPNFGAGYLQNVSPALALFQNLDS